MKIKPNKIAQIFDEKDYGLLYGEVVSAIYGENPAIDFEYFPFLCEMLFAECGYARKSFWREDEVKKTVVRILKYYLLSALNCKSISDLEKLRIRKNGKYADALIDKQIKKIKTDYADFWRLSGLDAAKQLFPCGI